MMMPSANLTPQQTPTVLVLGLGITGFSIVRFLRAKDFQVTVADSREFPPYLEQSRRDYPEMEIITGSIPFEHFDQYSEVIVSPGIDLSQAGELADFSTVGDIELFARYADAPVIGITGSNGKSTVTMLVSEILTSAGFQVNTGGNIGTPALDLLTGDTPDFYVLELSSFQLDSTHSLDLASATVLNISEDHMDRYADLAQYAHAKRRIYDNANSIVVNRDDHQSRPLEDNNQTCFSFGMDEPRTSFEFGIKQTDGKGGMFQGDICLGDVEHIVMQGNQNISNILAALALVAAVGVKLKPGHARAAFRYGGLPHRCEVVTEVNGCKWINDSKGTNVGATIAAIQGISEDIVLIVGGKGKGADFSPLAKIIERRVKFTILFGEDASLISSVLSASSAHTLVASLDQAVAEADKVASSGDVVLFSPACASFDMFDNFEHRGNVFKNRVLEYVH